VARRSFLVLLSSLALVILVSSLTPTRVEAQRTAEGILVLSNTRWDSVRVEVRVGPSTDCSANPPHVVRTLRRNQRWAIVTSEVMCWRREQTPGDASTPWASWGQARVTADSIRSDSL